MKRGLLLMAILGLLLVCGCWDQREINDLALVVAVGSDLTEKAGRGEVRFTCQIANPIALIPGSGGTGAGVGGPKAFWTITGIGRTVWDAAMDITDRIPKKVFFGHTRVFVVGEKAARKGVVPFLDSTVRGRESRTNMYLVVAKGEAKKVLETEMPTFRSSGLALSNMFDTLGGNHTIMPVNVNDFNYRLSSGTTAPVASVVAVVPQTSVSAEDLKTPGGPANTIKISGLAVFDQKGRLLGFFTEKETAGLMWVLNKVKSRAITIADPAVGPREKISLGLVRSRSQIVVTMDQNGWPEFEIRVKTICDLWEHYGQHPGMLTIEFMKKIERRVNTQVEEEIMTAVKKAQSLNADVFGLGEEVKRQQDPKWHGTKTPWSEVFPLVRVKVVCSTSFRHRGLAVETPGSRQEHR